MSSLRMQQMWASPAYHHRKCRLRDISVLHRHSLKSGATLASIVFVFLRACEKCLKLKVDLTDVLRDNRLWKYDSPVFPQSSAIQALLNLVKSNHNTYRIAIYISNQHPSVMKCFIMGGPSWFPSLLYRFSLTAHLVRGWRSLGDSGLVWVCLRSRSSSPWLCNAPAPPTAKGSKALLALTQLFFFEDWCPDLLRERTGMEMNTAATLRYIKACFALLLFWKHTLVFSIWKPCFSVKSLFHDEEVTQWT